MKLADLEVLDTQAVKTITIERRNGNDGDSNNVEIKNGEAVVFDVKNLAHSEICAVTLQIKYSPMQTAASGGPMPVPRSMTAKGGGTIKIGS